MPASISRLSIDVLLKSAQFQRDLQQIVNNTASAASGVTRSTALMERSFGLVGKAVKGLAVSFGAVLTTQGLANLGRMGKLALDSAGNLGELAQAAGVTTRELQALQLAGVQVGVGQEQLVRAMGQFGNRVADAARGTGALADLMTRYGISARDSSGKVRASTDVLGDFADAVKNAGSQQERLAIAADLFGTRIGAKLVPLLAEGSDAFRKWMDTANAAGLILSDSLIKRADEASDAMATLQFAVAKGFEIGVVQSFATEVNSGTDALRDAREAGETFGRIVGDALNGIVGAASTATPLVAGLVDEISEGVERTRTAAQVTREWAEALAQAAGTDLSTLVEQIDDFGDELENQVRDVLPEWAEKFLEWRGTLPDRLPPGGIGNLEWEKGIGAMAKMGQTAEDATGGMDGLTEAIEELTGKNKRLAEAGQILTKTSAQEERYDAEEERLKTLKDQLKPIQEFEQSLRDQLSLQRLQLQGVDRESEAYRVHVALLAAKRDLNSELTSEQERIIRLLEEQASVIDRQREATARIDQAMADSACNIEDESGEFVAIMEEIYR